MIWNREEEFPLPQSNRETTDEPFHHGRELLFGGSASRGWQPKHSSCQVSGVPTPSAPSKSHGWSLQFICRRSHSRDTCTTCSSSVSGTTYTCAAKATKDVQGKWKQGHHHSPKVNTPLGNLQIMKSQGQAEPAASQQHWHRIRIS